MKMKALIIDLDGTLVDSNKQVSRRSCNALIQALNKGIKVIIATARPPRAVRLLLSIELYQRCSFIYYNGAMISCKESQFSFHTSIDRELSKQVIEYCLLQDEEADLSLEVEDKWFALREYDNLTIRAVGGKPEVKTLDDINMLSPTKIIISEFEHIDGLRSQFNSKVSLLVTDGGKLVQISSQDASKEAAALKLCNIYGIDIDSVAVFGDDTNDIGMFKTFRHSFAMDNAIDELKAIASEITNSNDDDGVAIVVERICEEI